MKKNLHYFWNDIACDKPMPLITRQRIVGEQMMLSRVTLEQGFFVPTHQHPNEQFACVLSGKMLFGLGQPGSQEYWETTLHGGEVLHLPSNMPHNAKALEDSVVLDLFSPPSEATGVDAHLRK